MRIFLGVICKKLDQNCTLPLFVENAEKYGHTISKILVTCVNGYDKDIYNSINARIPLEIIDIKKTRSLKNLFRHFGLSDVASDVLVQPPFLHEKGILPYGFNRNCVLIRAFLQRADILFFVDSDVIPSVLVQDGDAYSFEEVDFFGRHLEHLRGGSMITTAEYSGYNILPPARFEGMENLLIGLQKEGMTGFWESSYEHKCLIFQPPDAQAVPGHKVLGGNVAFRMEAFSTLPPFFSSFYHAGNDLYLARGEDTVLSCEMESAGISCTDIQTLIFHHTYKDFPRIPDLARDAEVQDRFYYACTGWIGRNPFYNYITKSDMQTVRERQREHLQIGADALYRYTGNERFLNLPDRFDISWRNLNKYIDEYNWLLDAWSEFQNICMDRTDPGMSQKSESKYILSKKRGCL